MPPGHKHGHYIVSRLNRLYQEGLTDDVVAERMGISLSSSHKYRQQWMKENPQEYNRVKMAWGIKERVRA